MSSSVAAVAWRHQKWLDFLKYPIVNCRAMRPCCHLPDQARFPTRQAWPRRAGCRRPRAKSMMYIRMSRYTPYAPNAEFGNAPHLPTKLLILKAKPQALYRRRIPTSRLFEHSCLRPSSELSRRAGKVFDEAGMFMILNDNLICDPQAEFLDGTILPTGTIPQAACGVWAIPLSRVGLTVPVQIAS